MNKISEFGRTPQPANPLPRYKNSNLSHTSSLYCTLQELFGDQKCKLKKKFIFYPLLPYSKVIILINLLGHKLLKTNRRELADTFQHLSPFQQNLQCCVKSVEKLS